jgi:hypothetical protein
VPRAKDVSKSMIKAAARTRRRNRGAGCLPSDLKEYAKRGLLDYEWDRDPLPDTVPPARGDYGLWRMDRSAQIERKGRRVPTVHGSDDHEDDIYAQIRTKEDKA